jgi:hypothetical protein
MYSYTINFSFHICRKISSDFREINKSGCSEKPEVFQACCPGAQCKLNGSFFISSYRWVYA